MNIHIFHHIYKVNNYQEIVDDTLDRIYDCFKWPFKYHSYSSTPDIKDNGEFETLKLIETLSDAENDAKILYVHTKGVTTPNNQNIKDWREYMSYFCINKARDCIDALNSFDICGVDWHEEPAPHFSGNFWWANAGYIKTLPSIKSILNQEIKPVLTLRHQAEFWIGMSWPKVKCFHQSWIPVMERHLHPYSKEEYENKKRN